MTKKMPACLSIAAFVVGLALAWPALGQGLNPQRDFSRCPNVYGGGSLFVFSALDGRTSWQSPINATTMSDGLGFRFDLPRGPALRIGVPAPGLSVITWQMVTCDLLVGTVAWDTQPLIIAFASHNQVVGRLPASFRVSIENNDNSGVLLKNDVEGRTFFSFCYDPGPTEVSIPMPKDKERKVSIPSPAGQGAAEGYKISADGILDKRLEFYNRLPPVPDDLDNRWWGRTMPKAFSVLRANLNSPEGPVKALWPTAARTPVRDMGLWDTAFDSLGLMHIDVKLAKDALLNVYGFQNEAGMIPGRMGLTANSEVSNPPILGWAAWQVYSYDRIPDQAFLEKSFDVVQKHVTWFLKKRRLGGEPPPTQDLADGTPLYFWQSQEEAGVVGCPRFKGEPFAAVDLSCYLTNECHALQAMAQRLGYRELAKTWGDRGDAIAAAARRQLWDDQRGFFLDRKGPDGEWLDTWSYAGLLPLWSGVASPEQAARLKDQLLSKKFWTALPVPVVATDDKSFKRDLWSGATWINVNYMLFRGLQRYGYGREATELREKTLTAVADGYRKTGTLWEYYDPEGQKLPNELVRSGGTGTSTTPIGDYNWTAALYLDMILRPKP